MRWFEVFTIPEGARPIRLSGVAGAMMVQGELPKNPLKWEQLIKEKLQGYARSFPELEKPGSFAG